MDAELEESIQLSQPSLCLRSHHAISDSIRQLLDILLGSLPAGHLLGGLLGYPSVVCARMLGDPGRAGGRNNCCPK